MDVAVALRCLYPDVALVVVAASPRALDHKLGWPNLAALSGADLPAELTDLTRLAAIGVATDQRFGVALIEPRFDTYVWFAGLADRPAFERYLASTARHDEVDLEISDAGAGTLYLPRNDPGWAVVLRDQLVFYLVTAGARSVRDLAAVRLASTSPGDSLAADPGFRALFEHLRAARGPRRLDHDLTGYLSLDRLTAASLEPTEVDDNLALVQARLDAALGPARERGDPNEIAGIQEQQALVATLRQSRDGQRRLTTTLIASAGAIGFGIELGRARGESREPDGDDPEATRFELVLRPEPHSLIFRLLAGQPLARHRIVQASPVPPSLLVALHTTPAALVELIDLILTSRATSLTNLAGQVDQLAGGDAARALLEQIDGELGVAVARAPRAEADAPAELTALLGVADPSRAESLFSSLAHARAMVRYTDAAGRLGLPWGNRKLWLAVPETIRALVAATDPAVLTAVAPVHGADRSSYPTGVDSLLGQPATGVVVVDGWQLADWWTTPPSPLPPAVTTMDVVSSVPESAEATQLRNQLDTLDRELAEHRHELVAGDARLLATRADLLGTLAIAVAPEGDDLYGQGGHFYSRPLIEVVARLVDAGRNHRDQRATTLAALRQLEARRVELNDQLTEIRKRDIETWRRTHDAGAGDDLGGSPTRP